jgi:hypothetical protein
VAGPEDANNAKSCSRCGVNKPLDEFPIKNAKTGLRRVWCRDCCRAYGREHYRHNKAIYIRKARQRQPEDRARVRSAIADYLRAHPCVDCGERDILLLDFDHRDGSLKRASVSRLVGTGSVRLVMTEIAKCDVRCGNCHRKRTAAQQNWRKSPDFDESRRAQIPPPRRAARPSSTGVPATRQLSIWDIGVSKWCSGCRANKPLYEFAFHDRSLGTLQNMCRSCMARLRRDHYVRNRSVYIEWGLRQTRRKRDDANDLLHVYLREHPCVDCGESDIDLLEFDHVDESTKVKEISKLLGRRDWQVVLDEIAKCEVRCVNCHRRRTAERFNWSKRLGEDEISYNAA